MSTNLSSVIQRELSIRSESVQRIYNFYKNNLFFVNRRYQRKLIWTLEEKQAFIDSILKGYPVPIFLLAEVTHDGIKGYEIIDGMQRLNAITAFIEGEFPYEEEYFDLDTMVESKSALDEELLVQKTPKLARRNCEMVASYILPLSVYSFEDSTKVDEIFRRINSNGKHLSKQELRSAGSLSIFADLVRKIASEIRTDVTASDVLRLNDMKQISITNQALDYGISVDEIFWIQNSVITKEMVRESRDEEIVANILASMALQEMPPNNSQALDVYYGFRSGARFEELETALQRVGAENLGQQFLRVYNELRQVFTLAEKSFRELVFQQSAQRLPRYFEVVFLAFFELMFRDNRTVADYDGVTNALNGIASNIDIPAGGSWSAVNKTANVRAVKGIIGNFFQEKDTDDPANQKWLTEFETLLMQSKTEQTLYDFKQGFTRLDGSGEFDVTSFAKIIQTLTAMTNNSCESVGYVCVGVSENKETANRVEEIYSATSVIYRNFYVTGIEHEAMALKSNLDTFSRWVIGEIKKQPIDDSCKDAICRGIRFISYFDKSVFIFRLEADDAPRMYDGKYYRRHGSSINLVNPKEYPKFFTGYKK